MLARDVMTRVTWVCRSRDSLRSAAALMKERRCGFLPVLDEADRLVGVVTDRDLALSIALPSVDPTAARVPRLLPLRALARPPASRR